MAFELLAHTYLIAAPEIGEEEARRVVDAAVEEARAKHPDFDRFLPGIEFLSLAFFTDHRKMPLKDYFETLYCAVKHGDFTKSWREKLKPAAGLGASHKLTFIRTFDFDLVRSIVTDASIFPHLTDNADPAAFALPVGEWNWYVLVYDGAALLGLFWAVPYNSVCWEVHTCFLPALRGGRAIRAYREGTLWLWANSPCKKVIGNIPESNRAALAVALRGGAKIIGRNTKSLSRGGPLVDQIIVGVGSEKE